MSGGRSRRIIRVSETHWVVTCRPCGKSSKRSFESEPEARRYWSQHVNSDQHRRHFTAEGTADRKQVRDWEAFAKNFWAATKS